MRCDELAVDPMGDAAAAYERRRVASDTREPRGRGSGGGDAHDAVGEAHEEQRDALQERNRDREREGLARAVCFTEESSRGNVSFLDRRATVEQTSKQHRVAVAAVH